ncbi:rubredoxin [Cyanidioschyzon merolae strain 10D]|jgi:rubredoxin|uniref:Rubredoxin n=1 Tax=Cyanidioschyzon merolae (strain NIES-3377 / 10D) TaxID=280699 RepID=M1VLX4_CYAM1|nr:rubredoxin [Cyanidioschyzon merolae strain 10D]BAM82798.1 rubredoxin [Cyanidioschyzon merolae strain 10D]|eukprot:XP_005538834.1 rubredoxin [Cyanidioschyzon merolae strain 10D]
MSTDGETRKLAFILAPLLRTGQWQLALRTAPRCRLRAGGWKRSAGRGALRASLSPESSASESGGSTRNGSQGTEGLLQDKSTDGTGAQPATDLSPAEAEQLRKKQEADALRAAERFMERDEGNFACTSCGYVYTPQTGETFLGIPPGTQFEDIDAGTFRCPVCRSPKSAFQPARTVVAGFAVNQKYGIGANALTPAQKNALIFGGLFAAFLLLLSGYLMS